jgi:hypothetical protein
MELWSFMTEDTVVVPEDHKVVVFQPTPRPSFGQAESGFWILNSAMAVISTERSTLSTLSSGAPINRTYNPARRLGVCQSNDERYATVLA